MLKLFAEDASRKTGSRTLTPEEVEAVSGADLPFPNLTWDHTPIYGPDGGLIDYQMDERSND